jgi:hypothetical protein
LAETERIGVGECKEELPVQSDGYAEECLGDLVVEDLDVGKETGKVETKRERFS